MGVFFTYVPDGGDAARMGALAPARFIFDMGFVVSEIARGPWQSGTELARSLVEETSER